MLIYIGIFVFKIIEDALGTLRIIVVSNGKKKLGAFLQFLNALVWVLVTGTVITNINKDPLKIVFFALGSLVGSYVGSLLEEKIAMGTNVIMTETSQVNAERIKLQLRKYKITDIKQNDSTLIMVTCPRKKSEKVMAIIRNYDKDCEIITEKVKSFS